MCGWDDATIEVMAQEIAEIKALGWKLLAVAEQHWDEGPADEGWQSPALEKLCAEARAALQR